MPLFDDLFDLFDADATVDPIEPEGTTALAPHSHAQPHAHDHGPDGLLLAPGEPHPLSQCMAHSDPLVHAHAYRFEPYTVSCDDPCLVDTDGDGRPDATCWGTPVVEVDGYVREDGTYVRGHYRTMPDNMTANNLNPGR